MADVRVAGPTALHGETTVPGAKNSISKLLVASMLSGETCRFTNVPDIGDTEISCDICRSLGMEVTDSGSGIDVQTSVVSSIDVPALLARKNRLAVMMLAPLLHRAGEAVIPAAGGDRIGVRPIDFHLDGYAQMGATIREQDGVYHANVAAGAGERSGSRRLRGAKIHLPYPSVTATENLLMAATLAEGQTCIRNAAIEPEVLDFVLFLQKMGAIIDYRVDRTFVIEGVDELHGASHEVMPDRLVAASLAVAAVASGGDLFVRGARQQDLLTFLNALRRVGGQFAVDSAGIRFFRGVSSLRPIAIETTVHPGFMTDWHPPFATLLTQADGMSVIHETVFEDRLTYVQQLLSMGAHIEVYGSCLGEGDCRFRSTGHNHSAVIRGPAKLQGANIEIPDLRAGITYVVAAIIAEGESLIRGVEELDRGYQAIDEVLNAVGAQIERVEEPVLEGASG